MRQLLLPAIALLVLTCGEGSGSITDAGMDADIDTDTDTDTDADSDSDTDDECLDEDMFVPGDCPEIDASDPCIRYVSLEGESPNDGTTWGSAFQHVQEGIDACRCVAIALDAPCQVWVAGGRYHIHRGCKTDTVRLRPLVEAYGGFDGTEDALQDRDWLANETILDGESASGPNPECGALEAMTEDCDTGVALHVVTGSDEARLDGFTVTNGWAVGGYLEQVQGAGMRNTSVSPEVANCTFADNHASAPGDCGGANGGGMYNYQSSVVVTDTVFVDNSQSSGAGGSEEGGGAVSNIGGSPELVSCLFSGNSSDNGWAGYGKGAAIYSLNSATHVSSCVFQENGGSYADGGALYDAAGSLAVESSVFVNNLGRLGGGLLSAASATSITNCTFLGNEASENGGGIASVAGSTTSITNCTVWGSTGGQIHDDGYGDPPVVSYSNVQGGFAGDGNIDADPLFVDAEGGDLSLQPGSPCVDAADGTAAPELDIDGNPRVDHPDSPNTGVGPPWADMGAHELQPE